MRAGLDVGAGHAGQGGRVVTDLEGAETFEACVLGPERVLGAAVATDERGGWRRLGGAVGKSSHGNEAFLLICPVANARTGRSWHLRAAA